MINSGKKKIPSYAMILAELVAVLEDAARFVTDPDIRRRIRERADLLRQITPNDIDPDEIKTEIVLMKKYSKLLNELPEPLNDSDRVICPTESDAVRIIHKMTEDAREKRKNKQ
jgi:hypothetical protein